MTVDRINYQNIKGLRRKDSRTGSTTPTPSSRNNSREDCGTGDWCEACWDIVPISNTQTDVYLTNNFTFGGFQLNFLSTPTITDVNGTTAIENLSTYSYNNIIIAYNASGAEVDALTEINILTINHNDGILNLDSGIVSSYPDNAGLAVTTNAGYCGDDASECGELGDLTGDGIWNEEDILIMVDCVLEPNTCSEIYCGQEAGDLNGDGVINVLDIVMLANCILTENCHLLDSSTDDPYPPRPDYSPPAGLDPAELDISESSLVNIVNGQFSLETLYKIYCQSNKGFEKYCKHNWSKGNIDPYKLYAQSNWYDINWRPAQCPTFQNKNCTGMFFGRI